MGPSSARTSCTHIVKCCGIAGIDKCLLPGIVVSGVIGGELLIGVHRVLMRRHFINCQSMCCFATGGPGGICVSSTKQKPVFQLFPGTAEEAGRGGADSRDIDGTNRISSKISIAFGDSVRICCRRPQSDHFVSAHGNGTGHGAAGLG